MTLWKIPKFTPMVVTPEQPTVEMHQADILIKALHDNQEVLVHFEFQTTDSYDPEMPLRMAGYTKLTQFVARGPCASQC